METLQQLKASTALQMIYKQLLNLTENGIIEEMTEDTIPREWQQAYEDSEQGEHTDPEKLLAALAAEIIKTMGSNLILWSGIPTRDQNP